MTSLSDAYRGGTRGVVSPRRRYAGTAFLLAGAALAVLALVVGTTDLFASWLTGEFASRKAAGILGGLAVPTVLVGVFTVLPSGRRVRAAAVLSASICLVGVALFWYAYPAHWADHGRDLTFFVSAVYAVGLFSAVACLFTAVVNFKIRNDPGGALEMTVTRKGETKVVEVDRSTGASMGGVGLLGATPDGEVETQTNRPDAADSKGSTAGTDGATRRSRGSGRTRSGPGGTPSPAGDGGTATRDIQSPLDDAGDGRDAVLVDETSEPAEPADRYCGNCTHFEYVRDETGMVPYCRYRGERMDDVDACEEWTPNAVR